MARKISPSQFRNQMRQLANKQRQAINNYNQQVRRVNRAIRDYNNEVKRSIDKYNQAVRTHNARVRANRQQIQSELTRLNSHSSTTRYTVFRTSVQTLHRTYVQFEESADGQYDGFYNTILDLSEREDANSLTVMNALLNENGSEEVSDEEELQTTITDELLQISEELDNRWMGALYSLSPRNPDAARHFCTSAREIFTQILEIKAPDAAVFATFANCEVTQQGTPTRRAKIKYFLHRKGMTLQTLEDFVDENIENILQLFGVFNSGTHGASGKFDMSTLTALKKRVEDGIIYLSHLAL